MLKDKEIQINVAKELSTSTSTSKFDVIVLHELD